ncbi:MAG: hypothetical protein HC844_07115 [Tabrizicola sp.]|nr:hypothetical protein [Tabrizicola sp.]
MTTIIDERTSHESNGLGSKGKLSDLRQTALKSARIARDLGIVRSRVHTVLEKLIVGARCCRSGALVNSQEVEHLCELIGCDRTTMWRSIRDLSDVGLVRNRTPRNGARYTTQGVLSGIDLTPLLDCSADLEAAQSARLSEASDKSKSRAELRGLKGELRRLADRNQSSALVEAAWECLTSIPERLTKLSLETIRALIALAKECLAQARGVANPSCIAELQHGRCSTTEHTHTDEKKRICKSAGEVTHDESAAHDYQTAGADFAVTVEEALMLLPKDLRRDIEEMYRGQAELVWREIYGYAAWKWSESGAVGDVPDQIARLLGERQAAVMTLLALNSAKDGHVRDLARYAFGCARRATMGAFMWGRGLRSALRVAHA